MADTTSDLIPLIDQVRNNPIAMQRLMLRRLEEVTNGRTRVVDPTNPFVFLMEANCASVASAVNRNEALTRRLYPSVAVTDEELYLHMSDKDYLNRFSTPARTNISIILSLDEVKQKAVIVPNTNGTKKLTIPRHTEITVADVSFTLQYPIEIRILPFGGMVITYDVQKPSPLYTKESNQVDWFVVTIQGNQYIRINFDITQIKITSVNAEMNAVTGFKKTYAFTDNFYYCRAFNRTTNGTWQEIKTTHTDQVYDPLTPTVVLKVLTNKLAVHIPQIYFNNGLIKDQLRLDIYTTKGPLEMNLANYTTDAFIANWLDLDEDDNGLFSAPLNTFAGVAIFSANAVTGGEYALTFDELRDRVVNRSLSDAKIPITNAQLETELQDLGYELVVNVDNITNRQFLATRSIDAPSDNSTYTGAATTIGSIQYTLQNLASFGSEIVSDNGNRITVKPNTVFRNNNGNISIVAPSIVNDWINNNTPDELAAQLNSDNLLFTPFFYVFDINGDELSVRPYHLDSPEVVSRFYVSENELANIESSTKGYEILYTSQGYQLFIELNATETIKALDIDNLKLQLSYIPPGSNIRVHFEGVLAVAIDGGTGRPIDDRYIFRFDLNTAFDIDSNNHLYLTDTSTPVVLTTTFDMVVIALDHLPAGATTSDIDDIVDTAAYPLAVSVLGVSHERFTIRFGSYLENLWVRSRSFVDSLTFDTYLSDVIATYASNVYERDILGNIVLTYNNTTLEYEYNILHWAGEPVLNTTGQSEFDAWLVLNPTVTSDIWDWILSLSNADRQLYITNIADIRIAPNSQDTPILTGGGITERDNWLLANPTSPATVFDWWDTLTPTQQHDYAVLAHTAGDVILDEFGNPTIAGGGSRGILRQADMLFIDGKYYFATDPTVQNYKSQVIESIVYWVNNDIATVSDNLIEQSAMYLYPKSNTGKINVLVGDGERAIVDAEQYLYLKLEVGTETYNDNELREALENAAVEVIAISLNAKRVAHSTLVSKLKDTLGDNVLSIELRGFMKDEHKIVTMVDNSVRPTLGKRAVVLSNRTISVKDAIDIEFVRHVD